MNKNIVLAGLGSVLEWAEFSYYAYLALLFSKLFFPNLPAQFSLFSAFLGFAVSYVARPLGGILFGRLADRSGRRRSLSLSVLLMGLCCLVMGCLPTYATVGWLAPILLLVCRFLQGLFVGGELIGAGVFVSEHAQTQRRFFQTSWVGVSAALGMVLGSVLALLVSWATSAWMWRVPFWLLGISSLVGFGFRYRADETPSFQYALDHARLVEKPLTEAWQQHRAAILMVFSLAAFVSSYIYICNVWWVTYVIQNNYFTPTDARYLALIGEMGVVWGAPLLGLLADRIGSAPLLRMGLLGSIGVGVLLFNVSATGLWWTLAFVQFYYGICNAAITAVLFAHLKNAFPVEMRVSGQSLGWNWGVAILGGISPLLAQALMSLQWGRIFLPLYLATLALIALKLNVPKQGQASFEAPLLT